MTQTKEERATRKAVYGRAYHAANPDKIAAYGRAYRTANRETIAAYGHAYYIANREKYAARSRAYRAANPERVSAYELTSSRIRKYNVTPEAFEIMLASQSGKCAVCQKIMAPPCVDHNHSTGAVRGLLCQRCNRGGGAFNDDPILLRLAADYFDSHLALTTKAAA
jgi:hypothetical protein